MEVGVPLLLTVLKYMIELQYLLLNICIYTRAYVVLRLNRQDISMKL